MHNSTRDSLRNHQRARRAAQYISRFHQSFMDIDDHMDSFDSIFSLIAFSNTANGMMGFPHFHVQSQQQQHHRPQNQLITETELINAIEIANLGAYLNTISNSKHLAKTDERPLEGDEASCPICFVEISSSSSPENINELRINLPCHHSFHLSCLRSWVDTDKNTCPVCRAPVYIDFASNRLIGTVPIQ